MYMYTSVSRVHTHMGRSVWNMRKNLAQVQKKKFEKQENKNMKNFISKLQTGPGQGPTLCQKNVDDERVRLGTSRPVRIIVVQLGQKCRKS